MELIYRKIEDLKKFDGNPRSISEEQLRKLKESIESNPDYFEARPIILSDRTGEFVIISGNQRYEACVQLGMKKVPTVLIPNLTEEKEHEIMIRDNVSNGEWDVAKLLDFDCDKLLEWGVEGSEISMDRELRGSSFQVASINDRKATKEEYAKTLQYEFTLPLPNNRKWDLDKSIIPIFNKL